MSGFYSEKGVNYGLVILIAVLAAVISSVVTYKATAGSGAKFAIIDIPRVLMSSKDVAALKSEREAQINELQKMAKDANVKIEAEKDKAARKKLSEKYLAEINEKKDGYDKVYASAIQASDQKLNELILSVAKKEGLAVVIKKEAVINGGTDITESVIDLVK